MKQLIISVLLTVLLLIVGVASQDGNGQERGLNRLARNRNATVVGNCTRTAAILLTCPFLGNGLIIGDRQDRVTGITFGIQLCNSSLSVNLTLSNGMVRNAANFAQCDTTVTLGQLVFAINVAVFNDSNNLIVVNTSAALNMGAGNFPLFGATSIPLTQQNPRTCNGGVTPPPETCSSSGATFYGSILFIIVATVLTLLYNVGV